jgi:hypothetical protein
MGQQFVAGGDKAAIGTGAIIGKNRRVGRVEAARLVPADHMDRGQAQVGMDFAYDPADTVAIVGRRVRLG